MGALMLFVVIALVAVNLVFTVKIWKAGVLGMGAKGKKQVEIPRGIDRSSFNKDLAGNSNMDLKALIAQVTEQMEIDADESGEEEIQVSDEDIEKAKAAVLASLVK